MLTHDAPAVSIEGLHIRYGRQDAVTGLDLRVETGSLTALIGPNGAGKTSTVECCEGYRRPTAGTVRVLGLDPHRQSARLRHRVGVMLQEGAGMHQSVECAAMLTHVARLYAEPRDPHALLAELGLDRVARTTVRRLSGGERQRLALACALVGRPELLFADEPTAGLDPRARQACWALLEEVRAAGTTIVLTTHQIDDVERVADDVVIIDRGRTVAAGSPAELTGGQVGVSFTARPGLDLPTLRAALPDTVEVIEPTPGRYLVGADDVGPEVLATVTSWCANQGEMPRDLQVGRRSLEDVFLELTGRELAE